MLCYMRNQINMYKIIFTVAAVGVINSGNGSLAPFITKCKWDDAECIKETAQATIPIFAAGIPELGVETLDPFYLKSLDASSSGLKLFLEDITITGLKDCRAEKMQRDKPNEKIFVELLCDINALGKYYISGYLLVLPMEGNGRVHVVLRKLLINVNADVVETYGKDGVKHFEIKNWTHSYGLRDKTTLELDNLFSGNEVLAAIARELIRTSSNEIFTEVGPPIVKAVATKIIDSLKKFFVKVPINDLSL